MSKLFLEELAPDMVLEKPIKDQFGLILFQKGIILSQKTINTLKMWGISEVSIEDDSIGENTNETQPFDRHSRPKWNRMWRNSSGTIRTADRS